MEVAGSPAHRHSRTAGQAASGTVRRGRAEDGADADCARDGLPAFRHRPPDGETPGQAQDSINDYRRSEPRPLAPPPLRYAGTSQLLRASPPARPASVLCSSRISPVGVLPLAATDQRQYRDTPSHVPYESLIRAHAAYMPETIWAVNGCPPDSSRGSLAAPVSISSDLISTRQPQSFRDPEVWLLTVLLPVFSCMPGLFLPGGLCGVPGVPGSAPAPTVPGWYSFRVAGTVRAGQVGAGSVQSRFQQARNSSAQGQSALIARTRWRA